MKYLAAMENKTAKMVKTVLLQLQNHTQKLYTTQIAERLARWSDIETVSSKSKNQTRLSYYRAH